VTDNWTQNMPRKFQSRRQIARMTLEQALAIQIQCQMFNPLSARTDEERLAHVEAIRIIREEADEAVKRFSSIRNREPRL
jgi:hypothetical protein